MPDFPSLLLGMQQTDLVPDFSSLLLGMQETLRPWALSSSNPSVKPSGTVTFGKPWLKQGHLWPSGQLLPSKALSAWKWALSNNWTLPGQLLLTLSDPGDGGLQLRAAMPLSKHPGWQNKALNQASQLPAPKSRVFWVPRILSQPRILPGSALPQRAWIQSKNAPSSLYPQDPVHGKLPSRAGFTPVL